MPEKGVFTEDFVAGLQNGEFDLVVHSWKDLPTAPRLGTEVVATLTRADPRDVLLMPLRLIEEVKTNRELHVLSSSPRREYNLSDFLLSAMPYSLQKIKFSPVRGNVQTRVKKCLAGDGHALIIAKAALDRLLSAQEMEFQETRQYLRSAIDQCQWMVLPLLVNPPAAGQGALAIEIKSARQDLREIFAKINCESTFRAVQWERETLASFGGGCHLKIGVVRFSQRRGTISVVRALTPDGKKLDETRFDTLKQN